MHPDASLIDGIVILYNIIVVLYVEELNIVAFSILMAVIMIAPGMNRLVIASVVTVQFAEYNPFASGDVTFWIAPNAPHVEEMFAKLNCTKE